MPAIISKPTENFYKKEDKKELSKKYDLIYNGLSKYNISVEQYGGDTPCHLISAISGDGVEELMESIYTYSEILEIKCDNNGHGVGYVIDSFVLKGVGIVTRVLLHSGSIKVNDFYSIDIYCGRVKRL